MHTQARDDTLWEMPEDKPEEAPGKPVESTGKVQFSGKVTLRTRLRGELTVRQIQQSPDINPELLAKAREIARELKKTRDAIVTLGEPSKAGALNKAKAKFVSKKPKAASAKKSLSLFPVK
jgi:hypothetical protein